MQDNPISFSSELYPIERVLMVGPLADVKPLADRATAAGHTVTALLPEEEIDIAPRGQRVLAREEAVNADDYDLALDLHCTNLEAKADALLYLDEALAEDAPIITLTLAISTGELAREMMVPERVVGAMLLPPFDSCAMAELMTTPHTNAESLETVKRFFESVGLSTARVADGPAGVLGRTVCCLVNEAAMAVQERIASPAEIDQAMRIGANYPFGPLAWGDRIGLDRVLAVMDGLFAEFREERYRPAPVLRRLVRAGQTGVQAGMGFFSYHG
jgi:3-hydroxybutyryl-CoA dehydrogenase